ncbi:DUF2860 domain-containing protein [Vibrio sp. 10N.261.55.A7]|uniref:DUF2860 domain-containing protein n=1 Tax=Vibrio sp. 10N.261.55.A7 TaxID=1880851 RepID=UPI000C853D89|nr:DUF2860 domain-containing protein [Vibrio sp. 10N.261.55.A7]PMJ91703.1 hypothetical protein BCU12_08990 [Vibrio sp. 10N.261.55.A7]
MKSSYLILAAIAMSNSVAADSEEGRFSDQGWGGELSFLAGYGSSKSNLSTESDEKISDLNSAGKSESSFMAAPFGQVRYNFDQQQVFFGMSRDDIVEGVFALELGYAFALGSDSSLSFSYLPTVAKGEVWADPYLLNTAREKTDVSGNAYRVQYENIAGLGIDSDIAYYDKDVENELSGNKNAALNRDGSGYLVSVSTGVPLSESVFVMPSIEYHRFDADGKAMAFDKYTLSMTAMAMINDTSSLSLNGAYGRSDYDAENSLFSQTRKDFVYDLNLAYEYIGFLGWENVGFNILAGYRNVDSNINFYDQNDYLVGTGVSYLF